MDFLVGYKNANKKMSDAHILGIKKSGYCSKEIMASMGKFNGFLSNHALSGPF